MPKALSSKYDDRGEEGAWYAAEAADHDDDQRLGDHLQVHRVVGRLPRQLKRPAKAGEKNAESEDAGE